MTFDAYYFPDKLFYLCTEYNTDIFAFFFFHNVFLKAMSPNKLLKVILTFYQEQGYTWTLYFW